MLGRKNIECAGLLIEVGHIERHASDRGGGDQVGDDLDIHQFTCLLIHARTLPGPMKSTNRITISNTPPNSTATTCQSVR